MVHQAIGNAIAPESKEASPEKDDAELLKDAIDQMLGSRSCRAAQPAAHAGIASECDSAKSEEYPDHAIAEPTLRRYVRKRKQELGLGGR